MRRFQRLLNENSFTSNFVKFELESSNGRYCFVRFLNLQTSEIGIIQIEKTENVFSNDFRIYVFNSEDYEDTFVEGLKELLLQEI